MDYNIILKYTTYLKKEFLDFFRIVFDNYYSKKIVSMFVQKYIDVRYYNETKYPNERDFLKRINKELVDIYKELVETNSEETLKNIVALFGYIIYFDDIGDFVEERELIENLIKDENITIKYKDGIKKELLAWYVRLKKNKEEFSNTITSREFSISEKRLTRNTFKVELEHNIRISNLYSEYAINKAYNMEIVYEQRLFITYIMACNLVLEHAKSLDFSKNYIVDFASSLFSKEKKIKRLFNILDNPLAKSRITMMINYEDYDKNKKLINDYITEGYSFGVVLDSKFNGDINNLILFSYVFMSEDFELYDIMIEEKDKIKSKLIIL